MKRTRLIAYAAGVFTGVAAATFGGLIFPSDALERRFIVQYNSPGSIIWDGPIEYLPYADDPGKGRSPPEYLTEIAGKCAVKKFEIVSHQNLDAVASVAGAQQEEPHWVQHDLIIEAAMTGKQLSCLRNFRMLPYIQTYFEIDKAHAQTH